MMLMVDIYRYYRAIKNATLREDKSAGWLGLSPNVRPLHPHPLCAQVPRRRLDSLHHITTLSLSRTVTSYNPVTVGV